MAKCCMRLDQPEWNKAAALQERVAEYYKAAGPAAGTPTWQAEAQQRATFRTGAQLGHVSPATHTEGSSEYVWLGAQT